MWTALNWLSVGPIMLSCQHGNDPSGSIKSRKFDYLDDYVHGVKRNIQICRVGIGKKTKHSPCVMKSTSVHYNWSESIVFIHAVHILHRMFPQCRICGSL